MQIASGASRLSTSLQVGNKVFIKNICSKSTWIISGIAYSIEVGVLFRSLYKGDISGE